MNSVFLVFIFIAFGIFRYLDESPSTMKRTSIEIIISKHSHKLFSFYLDQRQVVI